MDRNSPGFKGLQLIIFNFFLSGKIRHRYFLIWATSLYIRGSQPLLCRPHELGPHMSWLKKSNLGQGLSWAPHFEIFYSILIVDAPQTLKGGETLL